MRVLVPLLLLLRKPVEERDKVLKGLYPLGKPAELEAYLTLMSLLYPSSMLIARLFRLRE
jgi:hypothetical protein